MSDGRSNVSKTGSVAITSNCSAHQQSRISATTSASLPTHGSPPQPPATRCSSPSLCRPRSLRSSPRRSDRQSRPTRRLADRGKSNSRKDSRGCGPTTCSDRWRSSSGSSTCSARCQGRRSSCSLKRCCEPSHTSSHSSKVAAPSAASSAVGQRHESRERSARAHRCTSRCSLAASPSHSLTPLGRAISPSVCRSSFPADSASRCSSSLLRS